MNPDLLHRYEEAAGTDVIGHLRQLAEPLAGARVIHVNSTRAGGGVAEILQMLLPLKESLGLRPGWEVIEGDDAFYQCTKTFHNALQGRTVSPTAAMLAAWEEANIACARRLRALLEEADFVFIHDPQPAGLLAHCPGRRGHWIWRCHIDLSRPYRSVWRWLRRHVAGFDASIFHLPEFAQPLPHPQYLIPPSIDPLADKNRDLPDEEIREVCERYGLDRSLPMVVQVSRYDRFKDPVGVIEACRLARRHLPLQLVLAGGGAADDPEGEAVLDEVRRAAGDDSWIHVLLLPSDAHHTINALQRAADLVVQKSTREGFGLTVAEAMWKGKPVIGGDVGGIRIQVVDHFTGFRVRTPEGAALRMRYLLGRPDRLRRMGQRAREFVRENFLITRHLRDYLSLMVALRHGGGERIEL